MPYSVETILRFGVTVMQSPKTAKIRKNYEQPTIKIMKSEKAKEFLLQHAPKGDTGAKEILALVLPEHQNSGD
jgi:hypothetical protein